MASKASTKMTKGMFLFNAFIGEGGFGLVLSGMFVRNKVWYAVKDINKYELLQHKTGLDMIFGELNALQKLSHPFIVGLQSAFHDCTSCYLVLDLKCGGDLRYYLRKKIVFDERDVAFYVACLSSALQHIHSMKIIHRDVKPENIILDEKGYPHLADFGVAYVQPDDTPDDILTSKLGSGTKQYLAPEVFSKNHIHGAASDFWSLGVTAYELLYSERPFPKHCPHAHISYLEDALKLTERLKKRAVEEGNHESSPARRESLESSPVVSRRVSANNSGSYSTGLMTTASALNATPQGTAEASGMNRVYQAARRGSEGAGLLPAVSPSEGTPRPNGSNGSNGSPLPSIHARDNNEDAPHQLFSAHTPRETQHTPQDTHHTPRDGHHTPRDTHHTPRETPVERDRRHSLNGEHALAMLQLPSQAFDRAVVESKDESAHQRRSSLGASLTSSLTSNAMTYSQQRAPHETGKVTTDHWTVDEVLPLHLRFSCADLTKDYKSVSAECVNVLERFFDPRPLHRLGGDPRRMSELRDHPWFIKCEVPTWRVLERRAYIPNFVPDKKFMQQTFWSPEPLAQYQQLVREEQQGAAGSCLKGPYISYEQERLFDSFDYVSAEFKDYQTTAGMRRASRSVVADDDDLSAASRALLRTPPKAASRASTPLVGSSSMGVLSGLPGAGSTSASRRGSCNGNGAGPGSGSRPGSRGPPLFPCLNAQGC